MYYWADEGRQFMKRLDYLSFSRISFIIIWRLHTHLRKWTTSSVGHRLRSDCTDLIPGEPNVEANALCQHSAPSLPVCAYLFHSSFWQFVQANCPNFFQELFSQIECDVELIIPVGQELGDVYCQGAFLPSASSILYHRDFLAAYTPFPHSLILKEHRVLICLQLSEVGSYCWVENIPLIHYNFYSFSSQQSIIIFIAILLPWKSPPNYFSLFLCPFSPLFLIKNIARKKFEKCQLQTKCYPRPKKRQEFYWLFSHIFLRSDLE